jgi:fatty-acyl-CoA synthase
MHPPPIAVVALEVRFVSSEARKRPRPHGVSLGSPPARPTTKFDSKQYDWSVTETVATGLRHFAGLLSHRASSTKTALVDAHGSTSYAELESASGALAEHLLDLGLGPGDRISFMLPNSPAIVCCYLAAAKARVVAVPISRRAADGELAQILLDAGSRLILHEPADAERLASLVKGRDVAREAVSDLAQWAGSGRRLDEPAPEDPFCAMFTGGTTGVPKAAVQTHAAWASCVEDVVEQWSLSETDRHLVVLPMSHVSWFTTAAHLYAGATIWLQDRWEPDVVLDTRGAERITTLNLIPTMLGDLVEAAERGGGLKLSELRQLTVAGSAMPEALFHRARTIFGPIIGNIYGMTETSGPVTYLLPADMNGSRIRSGGRPGRRVRVAIFGEDGSRLADSEVGEIGLSGPQMTSEYLGRPDETARAIRDGWLMTGDVGRIDADGFVFILDRRKDMIKSGGYNVYPKEIEEVLYVHPDVVEAAVVGAPDPRWIEAVHAFVVLRAGVALNETALHEHCRRELAGFKVPKRFHAIPAIPRTDVGKFDKKALRDRLAVAASASP